MMKKGKETPPEPAEEFSFGRRQFRHAYHFGETVENDPARDYFMCPHEGCGLGKADMKLGENGAGDIITTFTCPKQHQWVYNGKTKKIEHPE